MWGEGIHPLCSMALISPPTSYPPHHSKRSHCSIRTSTPMQETECQQCLHLSKMSGIPTREREYMPNCSCVYIVLVTTIMGKCNNSCQFLFPYTQEKAYTVGNRLHFLPHCRYVTEVTLYYWQFKIENMCKFV